MKKVKKIIAAVSAAAISASLIGSVPVFAANSEYTVSFGNTQDFNRVQLVWDEAQTGEVSVKVGEETLTGTAGGTVLNLYKDTIKTETKTVVTNSSTGETQNQPHQVFERNTLSSDSIKISADSEPSVVKLYKDEKLTTTSCTQTGFNDHGSQVCDDDLTTYGTFYTSTAEDKIPNTQIDAKLADVYDVSEFLLYTYGLYSWYPKSYKINDGISTIDGTPGNDGNAVSVYGYILRTALASSSDTFTVTFPSGGYAVNTASKFYQAFRVYGIELYGSKLPVWANEGVYTISFGEEKSFNRIQLTWDEAQTGTVMAMVNNANGTETILSGNVNGEKNLNLFDSSVTTSETDKGSSGGYKQSFVRNGLSADSITVFADKMPFSASLYSDSKIGFKNTDIDNDSVTGFNETGNSINRELLRDGNYDAYGTSIGQNSTVKDGSFQVKLDKKYNVSEFILYTWGPYGWYPREYTINNTEGTKGEEPDLINQSVLDKRSPWCHPYILTTPLTETSNQIFTIEFKGGGYSFDQATSQYTYGFRIQEIEFYGAENTLYTGYFEDTEVEAKWEGRFEGSNSSKATAYSAEFTLDPNKTYKTPTVSWKIIPGATSDEVGKTGRTSSNYADVSGESSIKYGLVLDGAYFDDGEADVTATFRAAE